MMTAFFFTLGIAISFLQWQGICMDDKESAKQFIEQSEQVGWDASKKMLYRQEIYRVWGYSLVLVSGGLLVHFSGWKDDLLCVIVLPAIPPG